MSSMADIEKAKRSPNFSTADCLLLTEVMGADSSMEGLSFHAYTKHRFTKTITSATKKECWKRVKLAFNEQVEVPQDVINVQKKWDNLIQIHKSIYSDFVIAINKTGGGQNVKKLSTLTEAVMDIVGRQSTCITGAESTDIDSCLLNELCATYNPVKEHDIASNFPSPVSTPFYTTTATETTSTVEEHSSAARKTVDVICCSCRCHRNIEALKEEKLKLQIKVLKRKLGEE